MSLKASLLRLACVLVVIGWAASGAAATKKYSLSGDGGYWIGGGMPIPTTPAGAPNHGMKATANATVQQTSDVTGVTNPKQMTICPWKLRKPLPPAGAVGQWGNNPNLFMVSTQLSLKFPASPAVAVGAATPNKAGNVVFKASGRTGPPTLSWCPGNSPLSAPCLASATYKGVSGMLTYRKTLHQFGGPGQAEIHGRATVWARVASPPPCKHPVFGGTNAGCIAVKGYASPAGATPTNRALLAVGAPFGYYYKTTPQQAGPLNVFYVSANTTGTIGLKVGVAPTPFLNSAWGFGGPWTTGQLTVIQPNAAAAPETFTLSGSDKRTSASGLGNISLVAGGVSNRARSGPNANRGWLFLNVTAKLVPVPSISGWGIGSLGFALLGIGAAGLALARRRK